jgi:hypothetical protein
MKRRIFSITPNYNGFDNNPLSPTLGGVQGKSGQRIMQVGARIFF